VTWWQSGTAVPAEGQPNNMTRRPRRCPRDFVGATTALGQLAGAVVDHPDHRHLAAVGQRPPHCIDLPVPVRLSRSTLTTGGVSALSGVMAR
jgi:hypothetical protein